jgi:uncharacterized repeat protein (TIGR01451 family)
VKAARRLRVDRSPTTTSSRRTGTRLAIAAIVALSLAHLSAQIVPGTNVNMVAGTSWPDGDPYLQRQNEPSVAVSTRNVLHLFAGANDYRTVDLPGLPADKPTGDAWLGIFKSFDGGRTWKSNLLPGYPQDASAVGNASPLKGFDAAADPTVRAGANGLFVYSGIAFQRAAIVGSTAVQAGLGDKGDVKETDKQRARAREKEKEREREEKERKEKNGSKQARAEQRARDQERAREFAHERAAGRGSDAARRKQGREQPLSKLRGGAEEDEQEAGVESGTASAVFVSTFADLDNRENGDPISYIRTALVDHDSGTRFLDKQWTAVDIPRPNGQLCVFDAPQEDGPSVRQSFTGGRMYVVYTAFTGSGTTQRGQILFSYSSDCGVTWSRPRDLTSASNPDVNGDGVVNTADLNALKSSIGKRCGDPGFLVAADVNGDCQVDVLDVAIVSRSIGKTVSTLRRVPQGASIAIHPLTGAVYVTWREFKAGSMPDAIQFASSNDFGATFSAPRTVATFSPFDQGTTDTSFRSSAFPTIAADADRIYVAWSARGFATTRPDISTGDARIVMSTSTNGAAWTAPQAVDEFGAPGHQIMPALTFGAGRLSLLYYDLRFDVSGLFGPFVDELPILTSVPTGLRHTVDVRIAQAFPGSQPQFSSVLLSDYTVGAATDGGPIQQLQFNPPNLPIFRQGTAPFIGDYIDMAASPSMRANADGTWAFNIEPADSTIGHAVWTDNRDVRAGPAGSLVGYTPPNSQARQTVSVFDPTQAVPACVPDLTGTRDQNVYSARFDQGLFAAALGNSKPLGSLQRSFALMVENASAVTRSYRLTMLNQPPGGQASFEQFTAPGAAVARLDVSVPPHSIVARTAFVSSSDPQARVAIDVSEIGAPGDPTVLDGGLHGSITLNGDPSAPAIENPRIDNPAIENTDIRSAEVFNPIISSGVSSPAIENPRIDNPAIENPRIDNVAAANPGIINPAIENPRIDNPAIENPAIENPRIDNADLVNGSISDTTWELTNAGNTSAAYAVKLLLNDPVPAGFKTQLIIHKTYTTPAADGCDLKVQLHNVVVANITTPAFATAADFNNPAIENPAIENATVALAPSETANITFRVFDPNKDDQITFNAAASVTPAVVAHAVNTVDAQAGITQPPVAVAVTITTPQLNDALLTGAPYSQQLFANVAGTWAITGGALPQGLTLDAITGVVSGTPTLTGTSAVTITFTDFATPSHTATRQFVIRIGDPLQLHNVLLDPVAGVAFSSGIPTEGGIGPLTWTISAGSLPAGLSFSSSDSSISGTTFQVGSFPFDVTVRDSAVPRNSATHSYVLTVHPPLGLNPTDVKVGLTADQATVAAGTTLSYTLSVSNIGPSQADSVVATQTLPTGVAFLSVNSATGSCTLAGSILSCDFGTVVSGGTGTALVQVRPDVGGVTLVSNADVVSNTPDTNAANNAITLTTSVTGAGIRSVWAANAGTNTAISIINPDTNTPAGSITLNAPAYDIAFSPDGTRAYAVNFTTDSIAVIDTATNQVISNVVVTGPVRAEVSPDSGRLYVTTSNDSVAVIDTLTLGIVTTVPVGSSPNGLAVAPNGTRVYVANRNADSVSVIDTSSNTVVATVSVGAFPVEVALSPNGKRLYVTNFFDNTVSVVDPASNTVVATVDVGSGPQGLAVTPDGSKVYVANFNEDDVSVIDTASNSVVATPIVSGSPNGVVASPDGNAVYVTAYNGSAVRIIDSSTNTVVTSVGTGSLTIAVDYARIKP